MEFKTTQNEINLTQVYKTAKSLKSQGARYVQMLAVNKDDSIDMVYSFMNGETLCEYNVRNISKNGHLDSISDLYFEAFVCENEISELFGLRFDNLVLDFKGNLYSQGSKAPMTVISPEELARREKEAKIKAAMEAKKKKEQAKAATTKDKEGEE